MVWRSELIRRLTLSMIQNEPDDAFTRSVLGHSAITSHANEL